ncbi:hypothetical protein T07_3915 [Trichinella nelsoni]|uniref:Uncharacterized protein n=1 Tax=Trichinella nelsoni TaxID=6336 RepID=A0A0V0RD31_9BILA|nr:hypothetical protein T07_3915 [Trichinella nelsoni]
MPCLHKQGTYHRNDFAQDATPWGRLIRFLRVRSGSSAVALCWLLLARAVSSSSRHPQGSLPHVLYVSTSVTTLAPNTLTAGLCSSLQYIEGFCRTGAPGGFDPLPQQTISDRRALGSMTKRHAVCRQKSPAVLAGGIFELGGMGGFIAAALQLSQPDL